MQKFPLGSARAQRLQWGTLLGEMFHISQLQVSDPFVLALPSPRGNLLSFLGVEREEKG